MKNSKATSQRNNAFQTAMRYVRTGNLVMAQAWCERADALAPLTVHQVWRFKTALGWEKFARIAPERIKTLDISPGYLHGEERRTYV